MSLDPEIPDSLSVDAEELPDTEFDLLFPQIPLEDDPSPPEDNDLRLVDDLADFAADEAEEDEPDEVERDPGLDAVMDWSTGEFYGIETGTLAVVSGDQAVVERVLKAWNTLAGEYVICNYGSEVPDVIASGLGGATLYSELARAIKEAGTIAGVSEVQVDDMRFASDDTSQAAQLTADQRDTLLCTVTLTLDTDEEPVTIEVGF